MTTLVDVSIRTLEGTRVYRIRSEAGSPEHVRDVLSRALELGCALLDAAYNRDDEEKSPDGMGQD